MKIKLLIFTILFAYCSPTFAQIEEVKETKEKVQIKPSILLSDSIKRKKAILLRNQYCSSWLFPDNSCLGKPMHERITCTQKAMLQFIYNNLEYPQEARDANIEGTVVINYTINQSGKIINTKIVKDIGFGCGAEAMRVVNMMPDWQRNWARGLFDECVFNIPIKFKFEYSPNYPPPKKKKIFEVKEDPPRFHHGRCEGMPRTEREECAKEAMNKYICSNLKYPAFARDYGIEGTCIVIFTVQESGHIKNAKVVQDIGFGCGQEALRVINSMPDWTPLKARGNRMSYFFRIPIHFRLE